MAKNTGTNVEKREAFIQSMLARSSLDQLLRAAYREGFSAAMLFIAEGKEAQTNGTDE